MPNMSSILWTGTAMALALAATPAIAQTAPTTEPATAPEAAAELTAEEAAAQAAADTTADTTAEPGADGDAIVVTGIRRSLESAKNVKRRSVQIVDAVVAEDIGKLPDIAVSETAARIPGVQVTRRAGEADSVLVRGLPDFSTTYNGREIFTAQTRVVALQDFPSANIAAIEVFKSSTADLVEAGLAGLVNVRSRKPFDFKGFEFAGSVWGLYSRQAGKWNPNVNLLVTNRWDVGNGGEFGALLNLSYTELDYLDSEVSNTDFIAGGCNGTCRFPDIQRLFYNSGNRVRPSVNAALQYRPNSDIEIYAEGLWQGFRNKISSRLWTQPLWGGAQYTNLDFRDGTDLLSGGTVRDPFRADGFQGGTFNKTDTYQFALGGSWDAGPLRLTADLARTKSKFTGSTSSVDFRATRGYSVDFDNETPEFDLIGFDRTNPANYLFQGYYEEEQVSEGDDWQFRMDADYESGIAFLPKIEAGFRFSDRDAHREFGNRFAQFDNQSIPISSVPLNYELFRSGFRGTDIQNGFRNWLAPTYDSIRRNRDELRAFVIGLPPGNDSVVNGIFTPGGFTLDDVQPNPTQVFDAAEKSTAGYIQAHYRFGEVVDGVIGLRAVRTKTSVEGFSRLDTGAGFTFVPVDGSNSYTDWLPNASARIHITPELQLRLSATQTRTRPTFEQLNPSFNLDPPRTNCNPGGDPFGCARSGGGGNPGLSPFQSNNYDASLEYFFAPSGFVAAAIFRRDLTGFIQNQQERTIDPVLGPIIVNRPFNTNKGQIDGAELQFNTFFDFDFLPSWARRFGTQANVTYLDTEVTDPDPLIGDRRIYGVSKWTWNIAGFYENGPLTARLSYNKRSKTLETIQNRRNRDGSFSDLYMETGSPAGRLDFSSSYNIKDNFTLFFDWTNILGKPYRQDFSSARDGAERAEYVRFLRFEETIFSGGIRFKFN